MSFWLDLKEKSGTLKNKMDRIDKALDKLSLKEQVKIIKIIKLIKSQRWENLDRKKLRGYHNIYRVRSGQIRIIYQEDKADEIVILAISRRDDKTYNF